MNFAMTSGIRIYQGDYPAHAHNHAQVMFGLTGAVALEVNGHLTHVDEACGLIIPAGASHGYGAVDRARVWVLDAPEQTGLERLRRFALTPSLRRSLAAGNAGPTLDLLREAGAIRLRRALHLTELDATVQAALHESWDTARLAALFCLSPQRFHARFVELTGETPQAHVRRLRLDAAQQLLKRGMRLDTAAFTVGYRSASALDAALARESRTSARRLRGQ